MWQNHPNDSSKNLGFTLIELLVFLSLFVVIGLLAVGFVLTSLSSSGKVEVTKEVRQNGSFILTAIESAVRSATDIECTDTPSPALIVKNRLGSTITYLCDGQNIASNGAQLNSSSIVISNCRFICLVTSGQPKVAQVAFQADQVEQTDRSDSKSSANFSTSIGLRNSLN